MPRRIRPKRPPGTPEVALLVETSNAFARSLLAGIENFVRAEGPWNVYLTEHGRGDSVEEWVSQWEGNGVIARIENKQIARALEPLRIPIVDLSSFRHLPRVPTVTTDNRRISELAYQHFSERGYRNFAFCGVDRFAWSRDRGAHFRDQVAMHGGRFSEYKEDEGVAGVEATKALALWVNALPKPVAIFAAYDARGQQVISACRRARLSVPEEVAVLGVDNDELMCSLTPPPLSSVIPDAQKAGWFAAELLSRMMAGENVAPGTHFIPPIGVATRHSTDTLAVDDARIAGALRYIREHATEGLRVQDVLARFPIARRAMERRMKKLVGRTPQEEIRRVQLNRAKELLSGTNKTLAEIAARCGFAHTEYFSVTFKRETGIAPSEYRKQSLTGRL